MWKDEHLSFVCLEPIKEIKIEVMDEEQMVGDLVFDKADFLKFKDEQDFYRDFHHKNSQAGKLRFNTLTIANPVFKDLNNDYKKLTPEEQKKKDEKDKEQKGAGAETKEEKKEEEKKEEKKEEEKKE